ncbi:hypothetical protein [Ralstonia soli]|uniref:Cell wall anchor protein n=1 Tax=Ralstonia soli TaxID=2953896 RepID=A0ABT1AIU0_9RALS|nr:hypothetical protein [Ralstonia soli]MCO5398231.1 hypothetical protein [Ralstonia soli]
MKKTKQQGAGQRLSAAPVAGALSVAAAVLMAGCGGGSDGSSPTTPPATPAAASLTGTAATGSALANANVAVTDSAGNSPCVEATITTTALGTYTCTLKIGEAAPFFVVVTDPTGNTAPLVSVTTTTPPAGSALTLNATPLTTAIVAALDSTGNPLNVVSSGTVAASKLQAITAAVVAQITSVLNAIGAPAGYDPFSTTISAGTSSATGNTADQVLDVVKIGRDLSTGMPTLATVDNPTPTPMATDASAGTALQAPAANVASLPQGAQLVAQQFAACFALPTAQRVLTADSTIPAAQGGPSVTSMGAACQDMVASSSSAAGIAYLQNGYSAGQAFYGILNSDSMTNAQFAIPEVMAFYPADSATNQPDRAVLNIKYLDNAGNPGNIITVARYIANGATGAHPSNWWVTGNQQSIDSTSKTLIRRVEQRNPSPPSGIGNNYSHFQNGIQFWINATGPGSLDSGNNPLTYARVKGPGLPTNGIVYVAPDSTGEPGQVYMDVLNASGTIPSGLPTINSRCGTPANPSPSQQFFDCPNFWFSRTVDVSGSGATTLASNSTSIVWAQPNSGADMTKVVKGASYTIELFFGAPGATPVAGKTITKTLLTDLVQATQGVNLAWNTPGPQSLNALNPTGSLAGQQTSLTLDWAQNPSAEQIGRIEVTTDTKGANFDVGTVVPKGATSATDTPPTPVPAFPATGPAGRALLFGYRMLDNSNKTAVYTYNY